MASSHRGSPDIVEVGQLAYCGSWFVDPAGTALPILVFGVTATVLRKTVESTWRGHPGISRY